MNQKQIVILGAGTAGTIMANRFAKMNKKDWNVTIVDNHPQHYYQPGFLFLPFGLIKQSDIVRDKQGFIPKSINYIAKSIEKIDAAANTVMLEGGDSLNYDVLIVATGSRVAPEETEGLMGPLWRNDIFDFYTPDGAQALQQKLASWQGGRLVVHITEMPIKCPVAPLEFSFLADDFFKKKHMRDKVELTYVTPLTGAFTKPKASEKLGHLLTERGINVVPEFNVMNIDNEKKALVSYDGKEVPFDLLVTVPTNKGSDVIVRSGLGDELGFIDTDHHTLQSKANPNIFVVGDATNVPASKAGSTAHFQTDMLPKNIERYLNNQELLTEFDGHANCFVESGGGKALLIDFNYEVEPLEGSFPFAGIGPMKLLKETRLNHIGKKAFRYIYWHMLLKARPIPFIPAQLHMSGKKVK
jgi:sulfide:quinone oxidoreductase